MARGPFNTGFPKINAGFYIIVVVVAIHALTCFFIIRENNRKVDYMMEGINPYVKSLEDLVLFITKSRMYTTNWVYLQASDEDKKALKRLHSVDYPELRSRLIRRVQFLGKKDDEKKLRTILKEVDKLIIAEQLIMVKLSSFDEYENAEKKLEAEFMIESDVIPQSDSVLAHTNVLLNVNHKEAEELKDALVDASNKLRNEVIGVSLGLLVAIVLGSVFISSGIRKPVLQMKRIIGKLSQGELPKERLETSEDVIGEMKGAVNTLSSSFESTSAFANEIRKGNFSAPYERLGENDELGNALIKMRDALRSYSQDLEQQVEERTRELTEKSMKLETAYGEIRDSIAYAKHIQEAILPSQDLITGVFRNSFIFYKPKDIVSGDFYWFAQKDNEVILAVVDCTGHGVPGALMTVIGSSLLNQIVNIMGITAPSEILTQLDKKVIETLKQQGGSYANDGMDLALFRFNLENKELTYAGAKRSLFLFREHGFMELKGDKFPIGSTQYGEMKSFGEHKVTVLPNDTVYMFSDGYQDQFGGNDGKKFMLKRFRDLLLEIHKMKMHDQALVLREENNAWTGNSEQTDDILVIGVRF